MYIGRAIYTIVLPGRSPAGRTQLVLLLVASAILVVVGAGLAWAAGAAPIAEPVAGIPTAHDPEPSPKLARTESAAGTEPRPASFGEAVPARAAGDLLVPNVARVATPDDLRPVPPAPAREPLWARLAKCGLYLLPFLAIPGGLGLLMVAEGVILPLLVLLLARPDDQLVGV